MRKRWIAKIINWLNWIDQIAMKLPAIGIFRPIRGDFSAIQKLDNKELHGAVLHRSQSPLELDPDSVCAIAEISQNDQQPWPIFWVCSSSAMLTGQFLRWRDDNDFICREGNYGSIQRMTLKTDGILAQGFIGKITCLAGSYTSITSNWSRGNNYYHWLIDSLTRLMVVESLPERIKILLPEKLPPFARQALDLLDIGYDIEFTACNAIRPERYYFCSPTAMTGAWNPLGYAWLKKQYAKYYKTKNPGLRIFITRRNTTRIPKSIDAIESLFKQHGFRVIDCSDLRVREQIELFSEAGSIAGIHGAAMTNLLWCSPHTPVLELFEPTYLNACFELIAKHGMLDYKYLVLDQIEAPSFINNWINQINDHAPASL